jgi:hypothetical protein
MKKEALSTLLLAVLLFVSIFPIGTFSGAAGSYGISSSFEKLLRPTYTSKQVKQSSISPSATPSELTQIASVPPQIEWNMTYNVSDDMACSVVQTSDGGYALAGGSASSAIQLVKTDANGNEQWSKTWNVPTGNVPAGWANSVIQTDDGGYALAGQIVVDNTWNALLLKTDANGNEQWNMTYRSGQAYGIVQTDDGGYALAASTSPPFGSGPREFWVIKTNSSGNMQWEQTYPGIGFNEDPQCIIKTSDGGYALAGGFPGDIADLPYSRLVKTDVNGNMQWSMTYRSPISFVYSLVQTSDGGYAMAGTNGWLIKTDTSGNILWEKSFGGGNGWARAIVQTYDGGYILAGIVYPSPYSYTHFAWLVKTDANGTMEWNEQLGETGSDEAYSLIQTSDGGYAMAGISNGDFWLVKLGAGAQSTTLVTCSPNPVTIGLSTTCTATVSGFNPTGTITWTTNSTSGSFGNPSRTLSSGSCSTTYTDTSTGAVNITASYGGDSNNAPSSGSTVLNVITSTTYTVTFTETGLLTGTEWSVTFDGITSGGPSDTITFAGVENGTYSYTVNSVTNYIASPQTGSVIVNGANMNNPISFTSAPYTLDFCEVGLPEGAQWSVTLDGEALPSEQMFYSFSTAITFYVPSPGVYSYTLTFPYGYSSLPTTSDVGVVPSPPNTPDTITYVIFIPNSNTYNFASWDPVKNSYNLDNPDTSWSIGGNCYGFASTALLFFLGRNTNPCLPWQFPQASSTSELNLATDPQYTTLNNAWLSIVVHQFYDQNGSPELWYRWLAGATEAEQFSNLQSSLAAQTPVVLAIWNSQSSHKAAGHAVVAWGIAELQDGKYAIAVYDPNYPESTQVASYDPSSGTFSYSDYDRFVVINPTTIDWSFFNGWSVGPSGPSLSKQFLGYTLVATDKTDATVSVGGLGNDFFAGSGNSPIFACGIPGSSGIEEGDIQVYAIPENEGSPTVDPASNESAIFISSVVNESGELVGYGYLLDATSTQGLLNFTVIPSSSGLLISAGTNVLNASVTFFTDTQQGYSIYQASNISVGADETINVTASYMMSVVPFQNIVDQGEGLTTSVTITNTGDYAETLNVTVYANATDTGNATLIASFTNIAVDAGNSTTLSLTWDTTGFLPGDYDVIAFATAISGETGITYDALAGSTVQIIQASGGGGSRVPYIS